MHIWIKIKKLIKKKDRRKKWPVNLELKKKKKGPKEKDEEELGAVMRGVRDKQRGKEGKGKRAMSLSWKREKINHSIISS